MKPKQSIKQQRQDLEKQAAEIQEQARQIADLIYKEPIDEVQEVENAIISKL